MTTPRCPICQNHYCAKRVPYIMQPCSHGICKDCASAYFDERMETTCPICRATVLRHTVNYDLKEMCSGSLEGWKESLMESLCKKPGVNVTLTDDILPAAPLIVHRMTENRDIHLALVTLVRHVSVVKVNVHRAGEPERVLREEKQILPNGRGERVRGVELSEKLSAAEDAVEGAHRGIVQELASVRFGLEGGAGVTVLAETLTREGERKPTPSFPGLMTLYNFCARRPHAHTHAQRPHPRPRPRPTPTPHQARRRSSASSSPASRRSSSR